MTSVPARTPSRVLGPSERRRAETFARGCREHVHREVPAEKDTRCGPRGDSLRRGPTSKLKLPTTLSAQLPPQGLIGQEFGGGNKSHRDQGKTKCPLSKDTLWWLVIFFKCPKMQTVLWAKSLLSVTVLHNLQLGHLEARHLLIGGQSPESIATPQWGLF